MYKAKILYSILSANVLQKHRTNKIFIVRFISMKLHAIFRATKSEICKTGQQVGKLFSRSWYCTLPFFLFSHCGKISHMHFISNRALPYTLFPFQKLVLISYQGLPEILSLYFRGMKYTLTEYILIL